jgi:hypothetical protein
MREVESMVSYVDLIIFKKSDLLIKVTVFILTGPDLWLDAQRISF